MWHTTRGERTLTGAEAALVRESLAAIYDALERTHLPVDEPFNSGVDVFDRLSPEQQLAMLAVVGEALLCDHILPPPLTALSEATAAAIFGGLQAMVEAELDLDQLGQDNALDPSTFWRSLVRAAVVQAGCDGERLPDLLSNDWMRWNMLIDLASAQVLGADDWNMEDLVVDSSPEQAAAMKNGLHIADDYFDGIAPDPAGAQLQIFRRRLDVLTGLHHADHDSTNS